MKTLTLAITAELSGQRLDKAIATLPEITTRSRAAKLIDMDLVRLAGRPVKASLMTQAGQVFEISIPERSKSTLEPFDFPLAILHEDEDLIVLNKPAGLVVHPAAGHSGGTLVNALLHHTRDLAVGFHEERPGIVHRLDKETSGVLVVAKTNPALEGLAAQFRARTIHRIYLALVHGELTKPRGTIESRLLRHPTDRKRFASAKSGAGKRAVTHFETVRTHPAGVSLMRCKLETGRTHQIRVHMSEARHPILGDWLYGSRPRLTGIRNLQLRKIVSAMKRIALHATELGFIHPRTGQRMDFRAPWPEDLKPQLDLLGWE
jgi:23S rRNA pseudouridine1911/1915/1917 synthase